MRHTNGLPVKRGDSHPPDQREDVPVRSKAILVLVTFSISIGAGLISGGLGGVAPAIRNVGLPLVCRDKLERQTSPFSYKPGQSGISRTTYCVDTDTGRRRDITFQLIAAAGVFYSVAVFMIVFGVFRSLLRR